MVSCVVVFDGQGTRVVYDDTHQQLLRTQILGESKSDRGRGVEHFILKPRHSCRNEKIDLLCI